MCNAKNHPPGCNCGWGGVWYGSSGGGGEFAHWLFNKPKAERKIGLQVSTLSDLSGGFTNPNAKCPVCGASVYFYESPYGGMVYFDELGPPWPKHPCTSRASERTPRRAIRKWSEVGWKPLKEVTISLRPGAVGVYSISGSSQSKKISLCFRSDQVVMVDIVRYRPVGDGIFELSILDYESTKSQWVVWNGIATVDPGRLSEPLTCSVIQAIPEPTLKKVSKAPVEQEPNTFVCALCSRKVREDRLVKHMKKVHEVILICVEGLVTGQMYR
ncbi:hypothetical protein FQZ97_533990 [compost metagenome]